MSNQTDVKKKWSWVAELMPKVSAMVAESKVKHGAAHVAKCQADGLAGIPGRFYAVEGAVAIGTPPENDPEVLAIANAKITRAEGFLYLANP